MHVWYPREYLSTPTSQTQKSRTRSPLSRMTLSAPSLSRNIYTYKNKTNGTGEFPHLRHVLFHHNGMLAPKLNTGGEGTGEGNQHSTPSSSSSKSSPTSAQPAMYLSPPNSPTVRRWRARPSSSPHRRTKWSSDAVTRPPSDCQPTDVTSAEWPRTRGVPTFL